MPKITEERRQYQREYYAKSREKLLEKLAQAHRDANREKYRARSRDWYLNNKDRASAQARKQKLAKYGLTENDYQAMVAKQKGLCAICAKPPKLHRLYVDHCHETGAVRGLLCNTCNAAIGMLEDDLVLLEKAKNYLTANGSSGAISMTSSEPPNAL